MCFDYKKIRVILVRKTKRNGRYAVIRRQYVRIMHSYVLITEQYSLVLIRKACVFLRIGYPRKKMSLRLALRYARHILMHSSGKHGPTASPCVPVPMSCPQCMPENRIRFFKQLFFSLASNAIMKFVHLFLPCSCNVRLKR